MWREILRPALVRLEVVTATANQRPEENTITKQITKQKPGSVCACVCMTYMCGVCVSLCAIISQPPKTHSSVGFLALHIPQFMCVIWGVFGFVREILLLNRKYLPTLEREPKSSVCMCASSGGNW